MVSKEQLLKMNGYGELHFTGKGSCLRYIGKRGAVHQIITVVRLSGKCKTWKKDPIRFRQPVKYGLWCSFAVEHNNQEDFHLASECPLDK
jgi:hypothetical protein